MKAKRVLVVEPSGNLWGSERVLLDFLSAEMNSEEFEITVCYPAGSPIEKELEKKPFKLFPHFAAELHLRSVLARLFFVINITLKLLRIKPDLIYVNQAGATRSMIPAAWLLRIPIVSHIRLLEDADYIASCYSPFFSRIYPVAISHFIHEALEAQQRIPHDKTSCFYDIYTSKNNNNMPAQQAEGGERPFVCVGRLAYAKGQDVLLDALSILKNKGHSHGVRFIGSVTVGDDFDEKLKVQCDHLKLNDSVEWCGYQSDIFSLAKHAIALVCPSRVEPLGRVVFEAWNMGLIPIVWEGSGGAAEIINASGGGILYEYETGECLADAMKYSIQMPASKRSQLIKMGEKWLHDNCAQDVYVSQMFSLWRTITPKLTSQSLK